MKMHNAANERVKRRYFAYLREAKQQATQTVDAVAKAIARFEESTGYRDFKVFHIEQAVSFKRRLVGQTNALTGEPLSKATTHATLANLKRFFHWLADQPGYRSRIQYADAEYFNLPEKDVRVATARREQVGPTVEQVQHVLARMPGETDVQKRDRALIALTLLTGARDRAVASLKLKHVDLARGCIVQDARQVATKFSKTITTFFFPVGGEVLPILVDWVEYLRGTLLWGDDDPLFPSTRVVVGERGVFEVAGLERTHWSSAASIRTIFRQAFEAAGLPYFNPHSFRHTLVRLGQTVCRTPEEFKAWSQNLGHDHVLTTFTSYGPVETRRQGDIIKSLAAADSSERTDPMEEIEALLQRMKRQGSARL